MQQRFLFNFGGWFIGFILAAQIAAAAIHNVAVNDASFSPALLTIEVGDTVVWENTDPIFFHSSTSDLPVSNPNYWTGLMVGEGDTFDHAFNSVGTFAYHDDYGNGRGSITVTAPAPAGIVLVDPRTEGGQFVFDATGLTAGKTNVLQASTNLTSWVAIRTNVTVSAAMTFTNVMTLPKRLFRLLEQP